MKLLAEALMMLEAADGADGRADFEAGEIADDGDAAKVAVLLRHDHDRDRVAVLVVDEQDLIENALEGLGRFQRLCHGIRITRDGRGVQMKRREHQQARLRSARTSSIWRRAIATITGLVSR